MNYFTEVILSQSAVILKRIRKREEKYKSLPKLLGL